MRDKDITKQSETKGKRPEEIVKDIPEQKKAAEELAYEGALLHILMDNIPDSIYFKDEESSFVKVNKAKAEHSKTRPEEMIGKTDFDFFPEKEAKEAFSDDRKVIKTGIPIKDKIERLTRKDGREVWVSATKIPWYNYEGKIIGTIGISRDITKRKKYEESLEESRKRFGTICVSAQDAIIILDHHGEIDYWNPAAERIFGYKAQEVMNKDLHAFLVPQRYLEAFRKGFIEFKKTGKGPIVGKTCEVEAIKKDGTVFSIELSVSAVKLKGKWKALSIVRDVTERKEAEERIRRDYHAQRVISSILRISLEPVSLEEQLERTLDVILSIPWLSLQSKGCIYLVEDLPDVLVMKAQRSLHESLLTACENVPFGRCLCGLAASTHEIVFTDCVDDRHETQYQGILPHGHYCVPVMSGEKVLGVANLYVKEGHKREQMEEEFLLAVANTLAGIIERKQAEEELKKHRDHLEDLVKERTDALNKQREKFISVLIHDLKGPLVPIMGYNRRLIEGKAKTQEDRMRIFKITQEASQNLLKVIENTSKDLRRKSLFQSFRPEDVDLREILTSVAMNFIPKMEEKGIEITINDTVKENWGKMSKVILKADPHQLKTLVENLLGNAIKYTTSSIKMELNKTNSHIRFVVADDGPGIPEKYQEKIFEEYCQLPETKEGTGIGLYSVKKVIENHKGEIAVHSSQNIGTSFEITLPC